MKEIEVEANSAKEAIAIALERLHAKRREVEIKILSEERKGLFGMKGQRQAKIKAILKGKKR